MLDMKDRESKLINLEIVTDHTLKLNPHGIVFGLKIRIKQISLIGERRSFSSPMQRTIC